MHDDRMDSDALQQDHVTDDVVKDRWLDDRIAPDLDHHDRICKLLDVWQGFDQDVCSGDALVLLHGSLWGLTSNNMPGALNTVSVITHPPEFA